MAATVTMTVNPQIITNSADTNDHDIDCSQFVQGVSAMAVIQITTGTVRFSQFGQATSASLSASWTTTDLPFMFVVNKDSTLHFRGTAGSEVFKITIVN